MSSSNHGETMREFRRAEASAAARMSVLEDLTVEVHDIVGELKTLRDEMVDDLDGAALIAVADTSETNRDLIWLALGIGGAGLLVALLSVAFHIV